MLYKRYTGSIIVDKGNREKEENREREKRKKCKSGRVREIELVRGRGWKMVEENGRD